MRKTHLAILACVGLAACAGTDGPSRPLNDLRTGSGKPEEFGILPVKPLVQPENYASLPEPTPNGANRSDLTPKADAVAALGGNPNRLNAGTAIPRSDTALINRVSRNGRSDTVRQELAEQDAAHRKAKSRFTWSIVPRDNYARAYRGERLEPYSWLGRFRRAGAQTPAAPPVE
ncbi:MAG: DUF3035 domain-containing protein [Pelagimonas sp.]|jgi:hypothetical protein|nr:DUF3035 domain-containing protein [Pelagimonas sp.]